MHGRTRAFRGRLELETERQMNAIFSKPAQRSCYDNSAEDGEPTELNRLHQEAKKWVAYQRSDHAKHRESVQRPV